jgi:hypothetical protein
MCSILESDERFASGQFSQHVRIALRAAGGSFAPAAFLQEPEAVEAKVGSEMGQWV